MPLLTELSVVPFLLAQASIQGCAFQSPNIPKIGESHQNAVHANQFYSEKKILDSGTSLTHFSLGEGTEFVVRCSKVPSPQVNNAPPGFPQQPGLSLPSQPVFDPPPLR